jgi:phosphotransferase system IIB component
MHFISLGSDNFSAFLFFKGNIKKLKKQVKRIRILINEKQLTDNLPRFFFR